jgi:hypothetical protein
MSKTTTVRIAARVVGSWLNRTPVNGRVPTAEAAYTAGRTLLATKGLEPSCTPWTASVMRADLEQAGFRL